MRILGIDPGTVHLGYGVVDYISGEMRAVDWGVVEPSHRSSHEERLHFLYVELSKVIVQNQPVEVAIEEPFVALNVRSAFAIGRAQAVAILAAANQGLPVFYYSPTQIKQQVTSYGHSDKVQVQEMVQLQLSLSQLPQPSDAADALAVAICHIQEDCFSRWLEESS